MCTGLNSSHWALPGPAAASSEVSEKGGDPSEPSPGGQLLFLLRKKLWKIFIPSFYLNIFMSLQAEQKNNYLGVVSEMPYGHSWIHFGPQFALRDDTNLQHFTCTMITAVIVKLLINSIN